MLRLLSLIPLGCLPGAAGAETAEHYARLFEAVRADMPCMENVASIADKQGLLPTGDNEVSEGYSVTEYANTEAKTYILSSYEMRDGDPQNAASVSIYDVNDDFPADLTNAFADIWDLPAPEPLRTDSSRAQFGWNVSFPNGAMQIIVSYNPDSNLAQIYGRTLELKKDHPDGCSR